MNKYEIRAESVLKKREEYCKKQDIRKRKIVTAAVVAVSIAVVICTAAALKDVVRPLDVLPTDNHTGGSFEVTMTQAYISSEIYNGKKLFISNEEKNYGEYKTCYINAADKENPDDESNLYGVLDAGGELVIPPVYDRAIAAGDNCFVVEKKSDNGGNESALIDSDGNILFDYFRGSLLPISWESEVFVLIADFFESTDLLIKTDGTRALNIEFENLFYAYTAVSEKGFEPGELIKGIYNGEYYLINHKGEIVGVYNEVPKVKKPLDSGLNLMAAYRLYQGNYKTLLFGVSDNSGNEIVPCNYTSIYFTGDRIVCRRGEEQGIDFTDVAVIYDTAGNMICESGKFHSITIDYGAETGIGFVMGEWDDEAMIFVGGFWVIDKNGNKLSDEYDKIVKNNNGTFTAYYDKHSKTHTLDEYGKIIE